MNTMKKLTALLLAVAATSLAGRAQTTNFIVNEFNTAAEVVPDSVKVYWLGCHAPLTCEKRVT